MQRARSARVRTAALGTTVGLCLLIPLAAASADSVRSKPPAAGGLPSTPPVPKPSSSGSHDFGNGVAPDAPDGVDAVKQLLGAGTTPPPAPPTSAPAAAPAPAASTPVSNAVCGKAAEAPGGIRAQTCVEREGSEVWARVYYRNPAPQPLLLVLSLLRPDAGTVQMRCTIDAASGDGLCETPRLRTDRPLTEWSAVAEIATEDGSRKLLRSGSATAAG